DNISERWVAVGRVLTPKERTDYESAQALKRLLIKTLREKQKVDSSVKIPFILVDKHSLKLRIEKDYFTLEEASVKYGLTVEEIIKERQRYQQLLQEEKTTKRRKRPAVSEPSTSKIAKVN
ncbi:hypothetical protein OESDEN_22754, partial [Oesophagostomum dentatum]